MIWVEKKQDFNKLSKGRYNTVAKTRVVNQDNFERRSAFNNNDERDRHGASRYVVRSSNKSRSKVIIGAGNSDSDEFKAADKFLHIYID